MDEKDLLIFLTLADTGNLTRTAEKLYLSQPTLSKRLQNMEADLGAALFLRSKQGVTLTPAGEAAREVIQRTARDLNTLREQLQMRKDTICGTLRIEVSIDYSKYRLPQVLAAYTAQCPDSESPPTTAVTVSGRCRTAASTSPSCGANTTGTRARSC